MRRLLMVVLCLLTPAVAFAQAANDVGGATPPNSYTGPIPGADILAGSDSFDGAEATMTPRFFRSGLVGDVCSEFSAGNFQYREYPFTSDATGTLNISFDPQSCGTGIFVTFHTVPFNPANICSGYVWSYGSSLAFTEMVTVPASADMVMVVSGVANAPGVVCGPFSYSIDGVAPVPTTTEWGMIGLAGLALLAGAWTLSRRRRTQTLA